MKKYCKHLIECQCILPIFKNQTRPLFHKFSVFSEMNNSDEVIEKWVKCNNCDMVHRVYDICKSELLKNGEKYVDLVTTLDDLKYSITSDLLDVLSKNKCEIAEYEQVAFLLKEKPVEENIVMLSKKEIDDKVILKCISFKDGKYEIIQKSYQIGL